MSCQTCLSDLRAPPAFVPPCCGAPICAACVAATPRLTSWVPCLRCGSSSHEPPAPQDMKTTQVSGQPPSRKAPEGDEDQFVLVGESDDEGDGDDGNAAVDGDGAGPGAGAGEGGEAEPEIVEITHVPRRGETLLSIARTYATDPHTLLALNDLPHAALYANPRLVATRPKLIVSRRIVDPATRRSADVTETEERKAQRALARFQAVAKVEEGVARAYLALHPQRDAGAVSQPSLEAEGGEVMFDFGEEKKRAGGAGGDALEHFYEDEAWEASAARPARGKDGRWNVVGAVLPSGVKEKT